MDPLDRLLRTDPYLEPFAEALRERFERLAQTTVRLTEGTGDLRAAAGTHEALGLHRTDRSWVFREWAPNAEGIFLVGDFSGWEARPEYRLHPAGGDGTWEIELPGDRLSHGDPYRLWVTWPGGGGDRIPTHATRVVQDPATLIFNAQVWEPPEPYRWRHRRFQPPPDPILVYETHVGMAQEEEGIGTYRAFAERIVPRIAAAGYNTIQLMAVQEHPYYGSFGYQVSSFFAPSSRFGDPEDLKYLVDTAHGAGLRVVMDIVHSHSVSNEVEGLSRFDGTPHQFFHDGPRGRHPAWDSRCFDYGKLPVLRFLLSNCAYWLETFRFDGFRFDGITSMLYLDHGLGKAFTSYADYFGGNVDEDAVVYLSLANRLVHDLRPDAVTIAEDISGLPGLALPAEEGGVGFDYRFAMGVADMWIRLIQDVRDEDWHMGLIWWELNNRRAGERSISYAECHDQALVGDKTLFFRMADEAIYEHMHADDPDLRVDRAAALHRLIRLITLLTAGHGYLNFMGNEFGHPEWIDFPRPGNGWSYRFARRQWHLVDHPDLRYRQLAAFDRAMLDLFRARGVLEDPWPHLWMEHNEDKLLAAERGGLLFVFSFHPDRSFAGYPVGCRPGKYRLIFDSDAVEFGGHGRLAPEQVHFTVTDPEGSEPVRHRMHLYIPNRTVQVLEPVP